MDIGRSYDRDAIIGIRDIKTFNGTITTIEQDYLFMMDIMEEMVRYICNESLGTTKLQIGELDVDFSKPWERLSFFDA